MVDKDYLKEQIEILRNPLIYYSGDLRRKLADKLEEIIEVNKNSGNHIPRID